MSSETRTIKVFNLGRTEYGKTHKLQQGLQEQRREGRGEDALLLTEHLPVFTLGRSHPEPDLKISTDEVAERGIDIVSTERGGDITYHGPGQLVGYGILDLKGWDMGPVDYVHGLEETMIKVCADWGLAAQRNDEARGVWIEDRKIGSVGINVRRFVTMHGFALNVSPDMDHFELINPCGMTDANMTSLSAEAGKDIEMSEVYESVAFHFARVFDCETEDVDVYSKKAI